MKIGSYELINHGHRGFAITGAPLTVTVAHTDHVEYTFTIPGSEDSHLEPWTYSIISYQHHSIPRHYDFCVRQGLFSHYEKITTVPHTIYLVNNVTITFSCCKRSDSDMTAEATAERSGAEAGAGADFILAYDEWVFSDQHFFHQDGTEIGFTRDADSLTILNY